MRSFRKDAKIAVFVIVAILLLAQAIRVEKANPPVSADISANPAVQHLLHRSCYNCHSNETVWPWYTNVAPASWLVASDVNEGRRQLNFSEWGNYNSDTQSQKLKAIVEEMQGNEMPPWYYSMVHSDARLTPDERDQIRTWAGTAFKTVEK